MRFCAFPICEPKKGDFPLWHFHGLTKTKWQSSEVLLLPYWYSLFQIKVTVKLWVKMQSWSHPFFLCVILTKYRFLHFFRFCKDDSENLSEHNSKEVDLSDLNVDPAKWRLSIDNPRCSSKCVLLHNENKHWRVRISDSATMKEKSVAMKTILALIRYNVTIRLLALIQSW